MSGMFWHNNYSQSVQIDALLSNENISLHELMDREDILQECKSQNKKLVEYLLRSDIMEELINLTTMEPSSELEERWRYKYSNVACELLTLDIPKLNEKLAGDENLLNKLYSFIDTDQPLNPLLASFFSKTINALVRRATDQNWYSYQCMCLQVLEFLKSRQRCVDLLLQHIETSAIMDLVLILLTKIEGIEMRQNILNWLDSQHLVQRLVQLLSPTSEHAKHANASQLLCDIITTARLNRNNSLDRPEPDPILICIQSEETINLILETVLSGEKIESSIVGGIQVLLTLLGEKSSEEMDEKEMYGASLDNTVKDEQRDKMANAMVLYLDKFINLLLEPPYKPVVKTTAGLLETPFGITRLQTVKLLAVLLSTENVEIREKIARSDTFQVLLDLFFVYSWNNFLHTQVQQCLALAINCDCPQTNEIMYAHIFVQSKLIDRILEAWKINTCNDLSEVKVIRQGYMGHLICMVNNIVTQVNKITVLSNFLKENLPEDTMTEWEKLISVDLEEINKTQQLHLGGQPENYGISSDGSSNEYSNEPPFPQNTFAEHQMYTNYQDSTSVPLYVNSYEYRNEKINDAEGQKDSMDQLNIVTFNFSDDDFKRGEELFNKVCDQKQNMKDSSEEDWNGFNFSTKKKDHSSNSSDEEDDDYDPRHLILGPHSDLCMDTDPWGTSEALATAMSSVNPWDTSSTESDSTGWANFDNFSSEFSASNGTQLFSEPIVNTEVPSMHNESKVPTEDEVKAIINASGSGDKSIANETKVDEIESADTNVGEKPYLEIEEIPDVSPAHDSDNNANPVVTEFSILKHENAKCVEETVPNQPEATEAPSILEDLK